MANTIVERISAEYSGLSAQLRKAADFVADNPVDVATRSLRAVAQTSGVSPATFSRLARALGYDDYEAMREAGRIAVGQKLLPFSERAEALQRGDQSADAILLRQSKMCIQNITFLQQNVTGAQLEAAVDTLHNAGRVLLIGALGSAGIVDYFCYQAQYFAQNWSVAGRSGASIAASFAQMSQDDAVIVLTKAPYAHQSLSAIDVARSNGFKVIVLTDSHTCPGLDHADHVFVLPTETANFFSSYVATLALIETMMSMLVARVGPEAEARIRATEEQSRKLTESRVI
ncbi:MurR/RpiR family transcriptional regulator [Aliishimia ponticola]|uniref:MurR/RpiR family transcriptional regulator n=1 Tax=Aliishimia ponticola TaxID=2499833 RepID=UPI001B3BC073|nr:MurR/RpiR family transcriptional regulator [Aliishimia ponticola]